MRQSNGYLERFRRTPPVERLRMMGRTKWYESVERTQKDLDKYPGHDNDERSRQGRNMNGRTSIQANGDGKSKPKPKERRKTKRASCE
ncbi:MAG: IS481 family transposase, partial [Planctomycetota bacterium]